MRKTSLNILAAVVAILSGFATFPSQARAQLVGDTPPPQPLKNSSAADQSAPATAKPTGKKRLSKDFTLKGDSLWSDTGIDLQPGEHVVFSAKGTFRYADAKSDNGPEGLSRGFKDLLRVLPFNDAGRGALIARIGDADTAQAFLVGSSKDLVSPITGRLALGINQAKSDMGDGTYTVRVEVFAADATAGGTVRTISKVVDTMPGIDNNLFGKIPRRIADKDGNPGDMVNFLILGSEAAMQKVFTDAGWVKVDADVKDTLLHGIIGSLSKESYVTMPMSQLYLFGRPQDYGWAHAEPISVVASRNHLRLWKAPFTVEGTMVWVGAATHDIGFERDQRNNGITHKIDPDIDREREYVQKTLASTGLVVEISHFLPENPMKEAKTATGGSFYSNGQVLVLRLADSGKDLSASFTRTFCSVLHGENPDGGTWDSCDAYLKSERPSSFQPAGLDTIPASYRVLVIPGILSSCQANTQAFAEGQTHLREKHGLTVEFLQIPNESSAANGARIAKYLKDKTRNDSRKYILVGYSKGAPDIQEALANDSQARSSVAAFISVAGAVGGSPIAETMPAIVSRYTSTLKLGSCEGDVAEAFKSLRQDVRQQFLSAHPEPLVPSFSLAAVSDATTTSRMLLETWKVLTAYDPRTDSQLLLFDALVPGGNYLGILHADHLAVALNYAGSADSTIRSAADRNRFPRAALLEAAVRSTISNLQAQDDQ
jgi:LssY C-terminus